jgi:hypothetical protein
LAEIRTNGQSYIASSSNYKNMNDQQITLKIEPGNSFAKRFRFGQLKNTEQVEKSMVEVRALLQQTFTDMYKATGVIPAVEDQFSIEEGAKKRTYRITERRFDIRPECGYTCNITVEDPTY